jgi:hypothetical protein
MFVPSQKSRIALGSLLGAGWIVLIWSEQVASRTWLATSLFVGLYAISFHAMRHPLSLSLPTSLAFGAIATGVVFTFWGTLLSNTLLLALVPTQTKGQAVTLLLINGAVVAAVTGLVFGYPLRRLFERYWWLPVGAAACIAGVLMFPSLQALRIPRLDTWGAIVTAMDLAFLLTLTPLVAFIVHRAAANNSLKPTPLRGAT